MGINLERVRAAARDLAPGSVLVLAADVYDALAGVLDGDLVTGIDGRTVAGHGVALRRSPDLKPGTIMTMASCTIPVVGGWADSFLNKAGPGAAGRAITVPYDPPPPPEPRPEGPTYRAGRQRRSRIVDT